MRCRSISRSDCRAAGPGRARAGRRRAAPFPSGRCGRTSASCWPTGSCSSTPRGKSAPPRSTFCRTAKARSAATARPAGGAVATEAVAAPAAFGRAARGGADVCRARRGQPHRGVGPPHVLSGAVQGERRHQGHSPAGGRGVPPRRRRRRRGRVGGRRGQRRDPRRLRPARGSRRDHGGDAVQGPAPAGARRAQLRPPRRRDRGQLRLRLGARLPFALAVGHHARRPLRPQLHAGAVLHAQLGQRLRREQRRRHDDRWTCTR